MRTDPPIWNRLLQCSVRFAIASAGLLAIVGSVAVPDLQLGDAWNVPPSVNTPSYPSIEALPSRATTTVGASAVFEANVANISLPSYQWCRVPAGSDACEDIPGATADRYTTTTANLADDGTRFRVKLLSTGGLLLSMSLPVTLAVSPSPPVVFEDGGFAASDWTASAIASPTPDGPTYTIERAASGGNPGAFLSVAYDMPQGSSSIRVLHAAVSAVHDPATQGAIYTIDFSEDCLGMVGDYTAYSTPMIRQAGRTYVGSSLHRRSCTSPEWQGVSVRASLDATDFVLVDGPACGADESCPDFSAAGSQVQLGLATGASVASGMPAGSAAHGIDNWRASVWRR